MNTIQIYLDKKHTPERISEVKKLFLLVFDRTEKTYYNTVKKNSKKVKYEYLEFFAKELECEVKQITNQPNPQIKKL